MTPGEKMVWAATFAVDLAKHKSQMHACEAATAAVKLLRKYEKTELAEDMGDDDDVTRMTREMLGNYEGA